MAKEEAPKKAALEKPEPPPKPGRGFPIRLLLWSIITTASTGALGYFAFKYREDGLRDHHDLATCTADRAKAVGERDNYKTDLDNCTGGLATMTSTATQQGAELKDAGAQKARLEKLLKEKEAREAAIREVQEAFASMVGAGTLTLTPRRGMLVVALADSVGDAGTDVLFDPGSSKLSEKGKIAVLDVGLVLKKLGPRTSASGEPEPRRFLIVGHTDNTGLAKGSKFADNLELSTARALTVTRYLIDARGMDPASLIPSGAGDTDPIGDNTTPEGRAANRRIEIVVLPAVNDLPPLPGQEGAEPAPEPPKPEPKPEPAKEPEPEPTPEK